MCSPKECVTKYRSVGEDYTKKDRHSAAYGKENILSHKSWLISQWALVAIATGTGSCIRVVWSVLWDRGMWKGPKLGLQPHCYHYQLQFLFTWTQSFWPLCRGPGGPLSSMHSFIPWSLISASSWKSTASPKCVDLISSSMEIILN